MLRNVRTPAHLALLCGLLIAVLLTGTQRSIAQSRGLSASELLQAGFFSYQSKDYPLAETQLRDFIQGYGSAPEAKQYMDQVLRLLSLAQLQQSKFADALPNIRTYLRDYPDGPAAEELSFWLGVCLFKEQEMDEARTALNDFATKFPRHPQIHQVRMMTAMARFAQEDYAGTLETMATFRETLPPDLQGRALPVILFCHLQLQQWEPLIAEIAAFNPYADGMISLAGVNLLALRAGSELMELDRHRDALKVLQKAWPQKRLLVRQQRALEDRREALRRLQARSGDDKSPEIQATEIIAEIERDLANISKIEGYDTALRFRIARCFFALARHREAYIAFREMIGSLPESDLLLQANYLMLVSLTRMERWEEAVTSADQFAERFPTSPLLPNVLYLKGEALMRLFKYGDASAEFYAMVDRFPQFPEIERCHFLSTHCLMMEDRNPEAVARFDQHLVRWPSGSFREEVVYWRAMAFYYNKQYEESRVAHADYIKQFPKGRHAIDARYRRAHALFGRKEFIEAYKELESFIADHSTHTLADEARNLLGDCYFAIGEIDRGVAVYQGTTRRDGRLYDYAQFRIGKALRSTEQYEAFGEHYRRFVSERVDSPRLTEALAELAWLHRKNEEPEKARDLYWDSIKQYGNDPEARGVEEMLDTLAKYYRGEKQSEFDTALAALADEADRAKRPSLAARARWMRSRLKPRDQAAEARRLLVSTLDTAKPTDLSATVLADVADALRESNIADRAEQCYRTILFWYPRSMLKDRAYAGLGLLAQQSDNPTEALRYFDLFERETVESPLWATILEARAELFRRSGDLDRAVVEWGRILEIPSARGLPWVTALYAMGETRLKQGRPKEAIPYFQRIYIMYGRWADYVAKSYWESGQAFEAMNMRPEAVNTYQEFAQNTHLKETVEYQRAIDRLRQLGEPITRPLSPAEPGAPPNDGKTTNPEQTT